MQSITFNDWRKTTKHFLDNLSLHRSIFKNHTSIEIIVNSFSFQLDFDVFLTNVSDDLSDETGSNIYDDKILPIYTFMIDSEIVYLTVQDSLNLDYVGL